MIWPIFVAHRGYPAAYPENSLIGFEASIKAGAMALEFDVQLSADSIPMVFHDEDLSRVTGEKGRVMDFSAEQLQHISIGEPNRFGEDFAEVKMNSLQEVISFLRNYPKLEVFVEIKTESIKRFGMENTVNAVLPYLAPIEEHAHLISFDHQALMHAREQGIASVGWVITQFDETSHELAESFEPDFLICNFKKIPQKENILWPGDWQWMIYATADLAIARRFYNYGTSYVETDDIGNVLRQVAAQV